MVLSIFARTFLLYFGKYFVVTINSDLNAVGRY